METWSLSTRPSRIRASQISNIIMREDSQMKAQMQRTTKEYALSLGELKIYGIHVWISAIIITVPGERSPRLV